MARSRAIAYHRAAMTTRARHGVVAQTRRFVPMTRKQVYAEIEQMFGVVPMMFKVVPDSSLELEWQLFKRVQFDDGPIPNKYRELIGLAVSAFAKCQYCLFYHTEVA